MRALITGGAGFIGSHLAERLLERGRGFRSDANGQPFDWHGGEHPAPQAV